MLETPVLFIVFNRPEVTHRVFEQIRKVRPRHLYIAADGPRTGVLGEAERCALARAIVEKVDWPCHLRTLFRDENVGCGKGPSGAISWFFDQETEGIILEDDCLPADSFFSYCADLLEYYRDDERVMHIGGNNSQFGRWRGAYSYYFSKYPHIWGWATWRRAWAHFTFELDPQKTATELPGIFRQYAFSPAEISYWTACFEGVGRGREDAWDIQWTYACWARRGLTVVPNVNLISNIGFDVDATHTHSSESVLAAQPTGTIGPLRHPVTLDVDQSADRYTFEEYNLSYERVPVWQQWRNRVSGLLPRSIKERLKKTWHP